MVRLLVKYQKISPFEVEVDGAATLLQVKERIVGAIAIAIGGTGAAADPATDLDRLRLLFSSGKKSSAIKQPPSTSRSSSSRDALALASGTLRDQGVLDGASVLVLGQIRLEQQGDNAVSKVNAPSSGLERKGADIFQSVAVNVDGATLRCTYGRGYALQPVFVCLTCRRREVHAKEENVGAVVHDALLCKACAVHCHAGHDVEQHGFWWHSRCDCPTTAFDGLKHQHCKLVVESVTHQPFLKGGLPPNLHNLHAEKPQPTSRAKSLAARAVSSLCYCGMDDDLELPAGQRRFLIEAESPCVISEEAATTTTASDGSNQDEDSDDQDEEEEEQEESSVEEDDVDLEEDDDPHQKKRVQSGKAFRVCQLCHLAVCRSHLSKFDLTLKVKFMVCVNSWHGGRHRYDRISVRCRTCDKSVCACCALHCHRDHDLSQPNLSEYAVCNCSPCIRQQISPEEAQLDSLRMDEIGSTMQRLLSHYPTDVRLDPFICAYCEQKHAPWLLNGGPLGIGTCYAGEIPVLPDSALQPVQCKLSAQLSVKNGEQSGAQVESFSSQGMIVMEDFLAEYTCKCDKCVDAYNVLFPGYLCLGEDLRNFSKSASSTALLCCTTCSAAQFRLDEVTMQYCEQCTAANPTEVPLVLCRACGNSFAGRHEHPLVEATGDELRLVVLRHMGSVGLLGEALKKMIIIPSHARVTCGSTDGVGGALGLLLQHFRAMEGSGEGDGHSQEHCVGPDEQPLLDEALVVCDEETCSRKTKRQKLE